MKHIAIFSANYLPNIGGVERYTFNLSKELCRRGIQVTIITSNVFNLPCFEQLESGIDIYRLPCKNLLNGRFPILNIFSKVFKSLNQNIKKINFDLVIINTRFYVHSLYGAYIGKKCAKKTICIEHGSAHLTINSRFWDFLGHIFEHTITFILKNKVNDFYGVSQKSNEWLLHFHIISKGCLYNAVDIPRILTLYKIKNKNFHNKNNFSETDKLISFTGRLVPEKGIINLIKAVNLINNRYKRLDIHLLVAGDGPLYNDCLTLKTDNIHLLGKLDFNEVITLLSLTSIFVLPTRSEGFTTSGLEAACCNNYIISTPVGGITELLINSDYGTILPENPTVFDIASSILDIVDNDNRQKIAKKLCFERVYNNFTWSKTADRICNIINVN